MSVGQFINEVQMQVMITCPSCSRKSPSWIDVKSGERFELQLPTDWKIVNLAPGCATFLTYNLKKMICPICVQEAVTDASHADAELSASSSHSSSFEKQP